LLGAVVRGTKQAACGRSSNGLSHAAFFVCIEDQTADRLGARNGLPCCVCHVEGYRVELSALCIGEAKIERSFTWGRPIFFCW
jgi:hypothetical protein